MLDPNRINPHAPPTIKPFVWIHSDCGLNCPFHGECLRKIVEDCKLLPDEELKWRATTLFRLADTPPQGRLVMNEKVVPTELANKIRTLCTDIELSAIELANHCWHKKDLADKAEDIKVITSFLRRKMLEMEVW